MDRKTLALALTLMTISAHAEVVDIQWNADGQFRHTAEIRAGGSLEICGKLPAGLTIDWSFTSSVPLESNVHYHEGKQVVYPAKHPPAAMVKDQLIVGTEQDYCWMWRNRTPRPIQMNMQLVQSK